MYPLRYTYFDSFFLGRNFYLKWRIEPASISSIFSEWDKHQIDQQKEHARVARMAENDAIIHIPSQTQ